MTQPKRHIHFVTGKLAAEALAGTVARLASELHFEYSIDVLPITVAALMTPQWIARHIRMPPPTSEVLLPGYCEGDLQELERILGVPVDKGPRDLRELPRHFKLPDVESKYGAFSIEIIAEINHAPKREIDEVIEIAQRWQSHGADWIDVGCIPGQSQPAKVSEIVRRLVDRGVRVSIDSFDADEVVAAIEAGAQLVLSVNSENRDAACDWGCEVVAIPDFPSMNGLEETAAMLESQGVPYRLDPILEPIGCGFTASLGRFIDVRRRFPDAEMFMGIGNLTELTDCDSAGINVLLLAICEELRIGSVLTTEVIPWARSSVKECDLARRLVHYAVSEGTIPKHVEPALVMLRDTESTFADSELLSQLAASVTDPNFRIFADAKDVHVVSRQLHLQNSDPFALFDELLAARGETIDAGHAFYLGFEMAKAVTAQTLGKMYRQDEALDWGFLTRPENYHRLHRQGRHGRQRKADDQLTDGDP